MKKLFLLLPLSFIIFFFSSCTGDDKSGPSSSDSSNMTDSSGAARAAGMVRSDWGEVDGRQVYLFTLTNSKGDQVKISNYGGTVTSWRTRDKAGKQSNIVLGFDSLGGYLTPPPYFGATIGRYGNRIAGGRFTLDNKTYTLATNNGKNHLHGGNKGFDKVVWEVDSINQNSPTLRLHYLSKDGEEGYPGNLKTAVTFTLSDDNELQIEYTATTDKATPVNLTNHSYFNLSGDAANTILEHRLQIAADRYTPVDSTLIPTGQLAAVRGTPFDFTSPHKIGERLEAVKGGYDHNFVLNKGGTALEKVATLSDSVSGRILEVSTTEPGLQFYSGNFLDGSLKNRDGKAIQQHAALCLETQHFPDSPNQPSFPNTILKPNQTYHSLTKYKVGVE